VVRSVAERETTLPTDEWFLAGVYSLVDKQVAFLAKPSGAVSAYIRTTIYVRPHVPSTICGSRKGLQAADFTYVIPNSFMDCQHVVLQSGLLREVPQAGQAVKPAARMLSSMKGKRPAKGIS